MSKHKILFIINPISGGKDKLEIPALVDKYLDKSKFNAKFSITEYVGHAAEIAEDAVNRGFDIIVAVGGDGTINEIASKVFQKNKILAIIPFGSGNGLARFLKIPMNPEKAVKLINNTNVEVIDTAQLNGLFFCNIAGIGFDAHISTVFANDKSRGLSGYLRLGIREVLNYRPEVYKIKIDGTELVREATLISVANSSQYGNNAYISPTASVIDGLLDVCIINKLPIYKLPILAYEIFNAKAHKSNMVEIIKGRRINIERSNGGSIHIDGEPYFMGKNIEIVINPLSLSIICP